MVPSPELSSSELSSSGSSIPEVATAVVARRHRSRHEGGDKFGDNFSSERRELATPFGHRSLLSRYEGGGKFKGSISSERREVATPFEPRSRPSRYEGGVKLKGNISSKRREVAAPVEPRSRLSRSEGGSKFKENISSERREVTVPVRPRSRQSRYKDGHKIEDNISSGRGQGATTPVVPRRRWSWLDGFEDNHLSKRRELDIPVRPRNRQSRYEGGHKIEDNISSERSEEASTPGVPRRPLSWLESTEEFEANLLSKRRELDIPVRPRSRQSRYEGGHKIEDNISSERSEEASTPVAARRRRSWLESSDEFEPNISPERRDLAIPVRSRSRQSGYEGGHKFEDNILFERSKEASTPVAARHRRSWLESSDEFEDNISSKRRPVMYRSWTNYGNNSPNRNTSITKAHSDFRPERVGLRYSDWYFKNYRIANTGISMLDEKPRVLKSRNQERHHTIRDARVVGVGDWLLHSQSFSTWRTSEGRTEKPVLFCYGHPGVGKTYIRCEPPQPPNLLPC